MIEKLELYNRLCEGQIWGVKPNGRCLAKKDIFRTNPFADPIPGNCEIQVDSTELTRRAVSFTHIRDYPHDRWQPEDFD